MDREKLDKMTKSQLRYILYRFKNEKPIDDNPDIDDIKKIIESEKLFGGWDKFSVTWDVESMNPLKLYRRQFSVEEEWDAIVRVHVQG